MKIAVIGTTYIDIKGYSQTPYIPAGRNVGTIENVHGGVGRNVAVDMVAAGAEPIFVSLVDESGLSDEILTRLNKDGVDTRYMRKTANGLGTWLAVFDDTGDVAASISKRSDMMPLCDLLEEKGDEICAQADSIAIEIDLDEPIVERVYALAAKYHKPVYALVSNMTIASERREYIEKTECFVCNQQEAGIFFGEDYSSADPEEMQEILKCQLARNTDATEQYQSAPHLKSMVVTMGSRGAAYATADGSSGFVPAQRVEVVDTTGAGDAFFAGVCTALTQKKSMQEACMLGTSLSAQVIQSKDNVVTR